jgi:hypothetical protein
VVPGLPAVGCRAVTEQLMVLRVIFHCAGDCACWESLTLAYVRWVGDLR